jgi:transcriptional regulator with XRE-family HTH domain
MSERRNDSVAEKFGENLRRERVRAGISQAELGLRSDVHTTEVSRLERGLSVPRIDTLVKLATGLGVKPEVLLDGIGWRPARLVAGGFA